MDFTDNEIITIQAAKLLEDNKTVFPGTGLPMLSAILAKTLYYPNLIFVFGSGAIDSEPKILPRSAIGSRTLNNALVTLSTVDLYNLSQSGYLDYALVSGAQVDKFGNVNSTVIGDYNSPKVRLTGSGAANDIISLAWNTIIMIKQDKKRFVKFVDFITSPGYINENNPRYSLGLPLSTGPLYIVTQLAVYGFHKDKGEIYLYGIYEHVSLDDLLDNLDFHIKIPNKIKILQKPMERELIVLRRLNIEKGYKL